MRWFGWFRKPSPSIEDIMREVFERHGGQIATSVEANNKILAELSKISKDRSLYPSQHHHDHKVPIAQVLKDIASQENNDGEPYDAMVFAAKYINELEERIRHSAE